MTPGEYAQILRQCLYESLQDSPNPLAEDLVCLRFGQVVNPSLGTQTDECCTGLAWVRVAGVTGLNDPDDTAYNVCLSSQRRLTLELGTVRCIPYGSVQAPPTCDQWSEATLRMDADHKAMEAALCCFQDTVGAMPFAPYVISVGDYEPQGPDGNCLRGTLLVTLDYACGC